MHIPFTQKEQFPFLGGLLTLLQDNLHDGLKTVLFLPMPLSLLVAHGENPCDVFYKQEHMCNHLFDCVEKLVITPSKRGC